MIQAAFMSLAGNWLGSLAATFASGSGLLMIVGVLAALYLLRKLSKKLADKLGIGIGPILAIGLIVLAFCSLKGCVGVGGSRPLTNVLPHGDPGPTPAQAEALERQARRAANEQALAAMNTGVMSVPTGTGPVGTLLSPQVATTVFKGTPPSLHGAAVLPHAAPHAPAAPVHVAQTHSAAAGGGHASPAPTSVKAASPPATGSAVTSTAPVGGGSPAPVSPGRTKRVQPFAGGGKGTSGTGDTGSGSAPAKPRVTAANEAALTLALRRRRQGLPAMNGDPGGYGMGQGGGKAGPQKHQQKHPAAGGMMPGVAELAPRMGGMFHPTEGGRLGVPFHPAGNGMSGPQPGGYGMGGGFGPMPGMAGGGMGPMGGVHPGMQAGGMGQPGRRR